MVDDPLERFVESMSVGDLCARLGCSVAELLDRRVEAAVNPPRSPPVAAVVPMESSAELLALPMKEARAAFERRYVEAAIEACSGNRARASQLAGMSRSALYQILSRPSDE